MQNFFFFFLNNKISRFLTKMVIINDHKQYFNPEEFAKNLSKDF